MVHRAKSHFLHRSERLVGFGVITLSGTQISISPCASSAQTVRDLACYTGLYPQFFASSGKTQALHHKVVIVRGMHCYSSSKTVSSCPDLSVCRSSEWTLRSRGGPDPAWYMTASSSPNADLEIHVSSCVCVCVRACLFTSCLRAACIQRHLCLFLCCCCR